MSAQLSSVKDLPRELKVKVRRLYHTNQLTKEQILSRVPNLTEAQLNNIISEQDDLEDFRLEKFNTQVRELYDLCQSVIKSVTEEELSEATVSARASLLKNASDVMRRTYELQMVQLQQSDDMALARLLALGRDEARRQLTERFRGLFHILFSGQDPTDVAKQLGLMELSKEKTHTGPLKYANDPEDADYDDVENLPKLSLVDSGRSNGTDGEGSGTSAQGIGAFRGIKKG